MDRDRLFSCRECGRDVAWRTAKSGKRYLAQPLKWSGTETFTERTYWPSHECTPDPTWRERKEADEAARVAAAMEAGRVERGVAVVVVKGRKVAHGVRGVVFWVASEPDGYGVVKVGMTTESGDKVFVNVENVEVAR